MKKRNDTWLRLTWDGNLRIARCQVCCMNWYLTIDGYQCSNPGAVDTLVYQAGNYLIVRHSHFSGVCQEAGGSPINAGQFNFSQQCVLMWQGWSEYVLL